jgi:squalene-hopene/tetraprenyl-beta-curcumene cyclase
MKFRFKLMTLITPLALLVGLSKPVEGQPGKGPAKTPEQAVEAGVAFLKTTQAEDGSWSKANSPGVTAVILTGLLKSGKVSAADPAAAKALKFIEGFADTKTGSLAAGDQVRHKNYITSVNLIALKASGESKYDALVSGAADYLKKGQVGAQDGKTQTDSNFGGFGYGPGTRSDLSNTHFVLDALKAVNTPKDDPLYKRTVVFVSRLQNLKGETNDQPWAGKINDGSFIYVLPQPGAKGNPDDPRPGYGSMTAAGLKSLLESGVGKDDPRVKKAVEWLGKNYSVDVNPGRDDGAGGQGYYYYLLTLAKALNAFGEEEFTDANGKKHNWRTEITRAIVNRQKKDGSWSNDFGTWMESNPDLCTGYALQTLAITQGKGK